MAYRQADHAEAAAGAEPPHRHRLQLLAVIAKWPSFDPTKDRHNPFGAQSFHARHGRVLLRLRRCPRLRFAHVRADAYTRANANAIARNAMQCILHGDAWSIGPEASWRADNAAQNSGRPNHMMYRIECVLPLHATVDFDAGGRPDFAEWHD